MNIAIGFLMTQLEEFVNCLNHAKVSVLSFAPNVFLENQVVNLGFAVLQEYVRYVKASLIQKRIWVVCIAMRKVCGLLNFPAQLS